MRWVVVECSKYCAPDVDIYIPIVETRHDRLPVSREVKLLRV